MSESVQLHVENKVARITINRPEALNSLNSDVLTKLQSQMQRLQKMTSEDLYLVVITGAGDKSFIAGADIKEMAQMSQSEAWDFSKRGQTVLRQLSELNSPVVAMVNGYAFGGGFELALACDFIYASENARFGLPEVGLGLIPGFGGTFRLARAVGVQRAKQMIFSGISLTAAEAFSAGFVQKVSATPADLDVDVKKITQLICEKSPIAVQFAKKSVDICLNLNILESEKIESRQFAEIFTTTDSKEGTTAFLEKRKPRFIGK